ncbi:hypothetical protein [Moorena sp. SIO2C4]|uniref:hypothetical protein n=1 Tax=Moorena sp. SIO2C4 TaxID=2607824 RepID=UPI0013BF1EA1|nr:hypothetical protein [Moorena sp. SIO2C4]NEQ18010.1 hypothetical protein [Moorena sp. SIO3E2]NES46496.1 hypothetical protein [Moorena sp. SIO2C4]
MKIPKTSLHRCSEAPFSLLPIASCLLLACLLLACLLPIAFPSWEGLGVGSSC